MILPKEWEQDTKDRELVMKLIKELDTACIETKCRRVTRSMKGAEIIFTPKRGYKPKVESIHELMMEEGSYISKVFLWLFRSMSLFFIKGSTKQTKDEEKPKNGEQPKNVKIPKITESEYEELENLEKKPLLLA